MSESAETLETPEAESTGTARAIVKALLRQARAERNEEMMQSKGNSTLVTPLERFTESACKPSLEDYDASRFDR